MQIQFPPVSPVQVTVVAPEPVWYARPDVYVGIGTMLLAAFTLYLALQTKKMREGSDTAMADLGRHAEHAAAASKESSEVAKISAQAAKASASHADAMLQSKRAWVVVQDWKFTRGSSTVAPISGRVSLVNAGETPALDVQISQNYILAPGAFDPDHLDYDDYFDPKHGALGANVPIEKFIEFKYKDAGELTAVLEEDLVVVWYGIVRYKDIFQKDRCTKWCFEYLTRKQSFELSLLHNAVE